MAIQEFCELGHKLDRKGECWTCNKAKQTAARREQKVEGKGKTVATDSGENDLSFIFEGEPLDVDDFVLKTALDWKEDKKDPDTGEVVLAKDIRRAIIYHYFFNDEDAWWRSNMNSAMISRRPLDFISRVPFTWQPRPFLVANPDCKTCVGTGQTEIIIDGEICGGRCSCCRQVFDLPKTRALQKDFNTYAGSKQVGSLEKAQVIYQRLSKYFIKRKTA